MTAQRLLTIWKTLSARCPHPLQLRRGIVLALSHEALLQLCQLAIAHCSPHASQIGPGPALPWPGIWEALWISEPGRLRKRPQLCCWIWRDYCCCVIRSTVNLASPALKACLESNFGPAIAGCAHVAPKRQPLPAAQCNNRLVVADRWRPKFIK
jgi:hypothetical protein